MKSKPYAAFLIELIPNVLQSGHLEIFVDDKNTILKDKCCICVTKNVFNVSPSNGLIMLDILRADFDIT